MDGHQARSRSAAARSTSIPHTGSVTTVSVIGPSCSPVRRRRGAARHPEPPKAERVCHHAHAAECHGAGGDARIEEQAEGRVEDAGSDRDEHDVVGEGPEQPLADDPHRLARQRDRGKTPRRSPPTSVMSEAAKANWGGKEEVINYMRRSHQKAAFERDRDRSSGFQNLVFQNCRCRFCGRSSDFCIDTSPDKESSRAIPNSQSPVWHESATPNFRGCTDDRCR